MANWNPKIPLNFNTMMFSIVIGLALSLPVGNIMPWIVFEPSPSALKAYEVAVVFSWLFLPFYAVCQFCGWKPFSPVSVIALILLWFLIAYLLPTISATGQYNPTPPNASATTHHRYPI